MRFAGEVVVYPLEVAEHHGEEAAEDLHMVGTSTSRMDRLHSARGVLPGILVETMR